MKRHERDDPQGFSISVDDLAELYCPSLKDSCQATEYPKMPNCGYECTRVSGHPMDKYGHVAHGGRSIHDVYARWDWADPEVMSFYIAGPMTGYAGHNFGAFDAARDRLVNLGHLVLSPADHDRELGITEDSKPEDITPEMVAEFAAWDLNAVQNVDALYMLPGWEQSKGARAEHAVAVWLGKKIYYEAGSVPHA